MVRREEKPVDQSRTGRRRAPRTVLPGAPVANSPSQPHRRDRPPPIRRARSASRGASAPFRSGRISRTTRPRTAVADAQAADAGRRRRVRPAPRRASRAAPNRASRAAGRARAARRAAAPSRRRAARRRRRPMRRCRSAPRPAIAPPPPPPARHRRRRRVAAAAAAAPRRPRRRARRGGGALSGAGVLAEERGRRAECLSQHPVEIFRACWAASRHVIRRADLGSKGVYYRAMVGPFGSREQAVQLCAQPEVGRRRLRCASN